MSDKVQRRISKSVAHVQKNQKRRFIWSLGKLMKVEEARLLSELALQVREAADRVDLDSLRPTKWLRNTKTAYRVVHASKLNDMKQLQFSLKGSFPSQVVGIVIVIAALKDASKKQ